MATNLISWAVLILSTVGLFTIAHVILNLLEQVWAEREWAEIWRETLADQLVEEIHRGPTVIDLGDDDEHTS